jgi:hypothetical protein
VFESGREGKRLAAAGVAEAGATDTSCRLTLGGNMEARRM